jgi:hypothetical protein
MTGPQQPYRLPQSPPEPVSHAEHNAFAALVAEPLPAVRVSAQAWRTGLTALLTLVTAAVVVQGHKATADLDPIWRLGVTLLIGSGLATCAAGLWHVRGAEAVAHTTAMTLSDIHQRHGPSPHAKRLWRTWLASSYPRSQPGRCRAGPALRRDDHDLVPPPHRNSPPPTIKIIHSAESTCGALQSADGERFRLTVSGASTPVEIPSARSGTSP